MAEQQQRPRPERLGAADAGRTRVTRTVAADPTSIALLVAGPAAVELWPGAERDAQAAGPVLVRTGPQQAASVQVSPPRRTPTAYVAGVDVSGGGLPASTGTLRLAYVPSRTGAVVTHAVLQLDSAGEPGRLRELAAGFLDNLAKAAEQRSRAA